MRVTSAVVLLVSAVVGNAWGNTIEYKVTDLGPVGAHLAELTPLTVADKSSALTKTAMASRISPVRARLAWAR